MNICSTINLVIAAIQRRADLAMANRWELRHFDRNYHCPQTDVSATFFYDLWH